MITIEQLNAVPRPARIGPFEEYENVNGFLYAACGDLRRESSQEAIGIIDTIHKYRDCPRVELWSAGRAIDEKIEFYQFAKAVAALFVDPKVRFCR